MTHRKLLGIIRDPTFWRSLTPHLTVGGSSAGPRAREIEASEVVSVQCQLREEGYFRIEAIFDPAEMCRLEMGLTVLTGAGWPALFVFLFDEPWLVYARLNGLLRTLLVPGTGRWRHAGHGVWSSRIMQAGGARTATTPYER